MKLVFMGTPDFSVKALEALICSEHEVAAVVTQPDRAKGRNKKVVFSPVKEVAVKYGIKVYQPLRVREPEFVEILKDINPDAIVVAAFGQILSKEILEIPKYGCINIHASLLPKYRGAAPIQQAVIDGADETGVTTMLMDVGLDTGDMLDKVRVPVDKKETGGSLHDKLAERTPELILGTLKKIELGNIHREKQDDSKSTYAGMLKKEMGHIDFSKSAKEIERLIRGLNPWPSAYAFLNGKTLKIWDADVDDDEFDGSPGQIVKTEKSSFYVKTGKGTLVVKELQLEGKKRMSAEAFMLGYNLNEEIVLC